MVAFFCKSFSSLPIANMRRHNCTPVQAPNVSEATEAIEER